MTLTQAQRSRIAREKAKRQKDEDKRLLKRTRTETIQLCASVIDHLNNHSPSCPLFNPAVAPTISAIFPLRDQAEEVSLRFCVGSHKGKKDKGKVIIHEQILVQVTTPPTFCALLIHGGGPSKATSPRVFSIYASTHDRALRGEHKLHKTKIGKELFTERCKKRWKSEIMLRSMILS